MDYLGTIKGPNGVVNASPDDGLLNGVLIAALGLDVGAGQPSMEISNFPSAASRGAKSTSGA